MSLADRNTTHVTISQRLQQITSIGINYNSILLKSRNLRNKVQTSLALFLLQLQRNVSYRPLGDTLHQMRCESSNFVAHALRWNDGDFINYPLVGVEIQRELRVVFLNDCAGRFLYGFGTNSLLIVDVEQNDYTMKGKKAKLGNVIFIVKLEDGLSTYCNGDNAPVSVEHRDTIQKGDASSLHRWDGHSLLLDLVSIVVRLR